MPKVSVILTSFNQARFIANAIDSVLDQSFNDFELIIWDDASDDDSWNIIKSCTDPRIRIFQNEARKRGAWGLNKAISEFAQGDYIAIHHSDDVWEPEKLEKQVAYLDSHGDIGAVFTHVHIIDERGNTFNQPGHFYQQIFDQPNRTRHEWLRFFLDKGNALCHPSVLVRKSCYLDVGTYRHGLLLGDFDMWVRLCLHYPVHVIQEKLTCFRILDNEKNSSGNRQETHVRCSPDFYHILDNFRHVSNCREFYALFPELGQRYFNKKMNPQYVWAMLCIEKNFYGISALYGLNLLFELLQDPANRKRLWNDCQFGDQSYAMLAENDVFLRVTTNELRAELAQCEAELAQCEAELASLYASRSWQITAPLRKLKKILKS